jgi:periplasmic divalent cation tolerance protein
MKVEPDIVIVMTNLPDRASASRIATLLIEQRHAACVNILADCTSIYRWQGKVETATEVPLLVKTSATAYTRVEELIRANHPYELPEIVGIPVGHGLPAYLEWVAAQAGAVPAQ